MDVARMFSDHVTHRFLDGLLASAEGRAYLLNQVADAEATDEGAIFDRLLKHVDDPKLRQMITRHQADELRHAQMLLACMKRTGVDPGPVPSHLRLLDRIDALAGHIMERPVEGPHDVMIAYVMLLVIEERAITQFSQFIEAFQHVDPQTADTFRQIARDEERHLRYCHAISRRYAPDDATWEREVARFRTIELQAYRDNSTANLEHVFAKRLRPSTAITRLLWRGVQMLSSRTPKGPRTPYWGVSSPPGGAAVAA